MTADTEARGLMERLTGFTPEPWSFDAEQGEWPGEALIGGNGDPVLDWDFDLGFQVSKSDARLIAAAPEMHRLLTALLAENERLRSEREPDFCYDPEDWEATYEWACACEMEESLLSGPGRGIGHVARVCTLFKGPDKWVAEVVTEWDENGDPDGWEVRWFDSEEEARAALKGDDDDN